MHIVLFLVAWYLIGIAASLFVLWLDYKDGGDTTVNDIGVLLLAGLLGPIIVGFIGCALFGQYKDKVVVKGMKKDKKV